MSQPRLRVQLWGSLRALADGQEMVEVEARTLGEILRELARIHPALAPRIERGVSFAVDGTVIRDDWLHEVTPGQEVVLMPRMVGG